MGREVRMVPKDWKHPKHWHGGMRGPEERYKPLHEGDRYQASVDEWDEECAKWKAGWRPDLCDDTESRAMTYEQWAGQRPHKDDYMPNWPQSERTHYMMYEDTSEGTPISPAFETPEELAQWLVDNKASSFGRDTASYESWLRVCKGGFAPSMIMQGGVIQNGVDALTAPSPGSDHE